MHIPTLPVSLALCAALSACASVPSGQTSMAAVHDGLVRASSAYAAFCTPTPIDVKACDDLKDGLNAAIDLWDTLPEED